MADNFKACSVDGCNRNAHWRSQGRRGFCNAHYKRWWRHGDPMDGGTEHGEPLRWLREVAIPFTGPECLIWPFGRSSWGHPRIWLDGQKLQAHRIVCELTRGKAPTEDHEAAHSCGNGHLGCIHPNHLNWMTREEIEADKLTRGTRIRGEDQWLSKLTEDDVRKIRAIGGTIPQWQIAEHFGVCQRSISGIVRRETWAWLPD